MKEKRIQRQGNRKGRKGNEEWIQQMIRKANRRRSIESKRKRTKKNKA